MWPFYTSLTGTSGNWRAPVKMSKTAGMMSQNYKRKGVVVKTGYNRMISHATSVYYGKWKFRETLDIVLKSYLVDGYTHSTL